MNNLVSQAGLPNFGDTPKNLVQQNNNGTITTTSLRIAEIFGKRHDSLLRNITELLDQLPKEWGVHNFVETPYTHPQNGQTYPTWQWRRK